MRIAFLGDASLGHVQRWVSYFHERGHAVLLFSYEDTAGCAFPIERLREPTCRKTLNVLLDLPRIRRRLAEFAPDMVNGLYAGAYGLAAVLSGRPAIVSALGSDLLVDYPNSALHRLQIRYALRRAGLVTTDARVLSEVALAAGAAPDRLLEVYFGIDDALFRPPASPPDNAEPVLVSTRNLWDLYRVDTLIRALAVVRRTRPARAVVCGDGPERAALESLAADLGVADAVDFLGRRTPAEIAEQLRRADIYVSTSSSDSTSVSLLEAMGTGLPPLVSDIPANREWLDDEANGLYFPVGDAETLARRVLRLLDDAPLRERQRVANLEIIRERGLWSKNMERVEEACAGLPRR